MTALRARRLRGGRRRGVGVVAGAARRLGPRGAAIAAVVLALLGGAWLWLRDSPLVAIDRVTVTRAAGPDARAIRSALVTAARGMTTLDVGTGQLRTAVSPYPEVKSIQVSPQPPHGIRIRVIEQLPVAVVQLGNRTMSVAGDGTLLPGTGGSRLPKIPLPVPPGGPRLTEPSALAAVRALAAAPYQLLARITQATQVAAHGVVAQLRDGPAIYLGDDSDLHAKWMAAIAVLASPHSGGASYIDVTFPGRPAAGTSGTN